MRILALSDTHFGYEYGRTSQAKKDQIDWSFDVFSHVLDEAKKEEVDLVLHSGDMFNRSQPKKEIISKAYSLIDDFVQSGIDFLAIPGNHDKSNLPETLLSHISKKLTFLNKLTEVTTDELAIIGFPFELKNPIKIFERAIHRVQSNSERFYLLFCHQLFDGATFGPHNHIFTNRPDTIKTDKLPENLILIISGHIHRSQCLQNGKVWYTGSTIRTSFMEMIESKGFLIIDLYENKVEVEFRKIPSYPMKVFESDISETIYLSALLDEIDVNPNIKTLIRLIGRPLNAKELKFLWARFPAKDFPLLRFSPRYPSYSLKPLFQ
jgi:DNA repair exonuclease SbcCD nuclease subunit